MLLKSSWSDVAKFQGIKATNYDNFKFIKILEIYLSSALNTLIFKF